MKIIGKTNYGYMIEADREEIAHLVGYRFARSIPDNNIKIGSEIRINVMYNQLYKLKQMENEIEIIKETLLKIVENLGAVEPLRITCSEEGGK